MEKRRSERMKAAEKALDDQLAELKADLTDKDLRAAAKSGSSLGQIKTSDAYRRDRDLALQALLKVPQANPPDIQHSTLLRECELSAHPDHTPSTLPLLLHQYYTDRTSQLVQLRHMHLVRWARFAIGQSKVTEELHLEFQERMQQLMSEYTDAVDRARRLSQSCDLILSNKAPPTSIVELDDVLPYLRWRVFHQHTTKNMAAFLQGIRWTSQLHGDRFRRAVLSDPPPPPKKSSLSPAHKKWLKSSHSIIMIQRLQSKPFVKSSPRHSPFATAAGLLGKDGASDDHVTMASALGGKESMAGQSRTVGGVPQHTTDLQQLKSQLQDFTIAYSIGGSSSTIPTSPSEQFHLYYQANRKFQTVFQQQEQLMTFYTYDCPPEGAGGKQAKAKLTFRKPTNWTPFIKIRPEPDPVQIAAYVRIRDAVGDIDPLLALASHCTHLHTLTRVLYALKQHCVAVRHPPALAPLSVSSHKASHDSMLIWKCIYSGLDSRNPVSTDEFAMNLSDAEIGSDAKQEVGVASEDGTSSKQDPSVDIPEAMQLIHSEGGRKVSSQAVSAPKDGYFAFVLLRHLRIRDLRNKCLGMLNYFRSVERTLTIGCEGLSLQGGEQQAHRSGGLLDHRYLFNTPLDYIINEAEFMQYMEVENHNDFYSFNGEGKVRVWDQRGVAIVYEATLEDLQKLETELLTIGSYFIQKDGREAKKEKSLPTDDSDLSMHSHQKLDRFAILLDLWTCESQYLEAKMKVINCYLEAYHHVYDRREKQRLAKVLTTLLASRPRYDYNGSYFTATYEKESQCLKTHHQLVQMLLNYQLTEERAYVQQLYDDQGAGKSSYGLPPPFIPKQLVSLSGDRQLLIHSHLLEFCSSLCTLASLPTAIQWALSEIVHTHNATSSPLATVSLHQKLLELLISEWDQRAGLGEEYSLDVQRNLFTDVYVEDPHFLSNVLVTLGNQGVGSGSKADGEQPGSKEKEQQSWAHLLQMVSLRHHLLLACSESALLTRLYKQQLASLGNEECHAHLRCVTLDLNLRLPKDKALEHFIQQANESKSESRLDRYTPPKLHLAVKELDEKHVGTFSFRSKERVMKLLSSKTGTDSLRTTLQAQLAHRSALVMACQQNAIVQKHLGLRQQMEGGETSQVGSATSLAPPPATPTTAPLGSAASQVATGITLTKQLRNAFVSLQQEKAPVRDHMLAQFTRQPSSILRSQEEVEKVKCALIGQFCHNLMKSMGHYSLRAQIMRYYDSLTKLLENFPATRDAYFVVGKISASSGIERERERRLSLVAAMDPRQYRSRPHTVLSKDGNKLLNLWYIPHFSEILSMFSELSIEQCEKALTNVLHLVTSLHTLLQFYCAYVRLGSCHAHRGSQYIGGDWGGTEGVGATLQHLQSEISRLDNSTNPVQVADFLSSCCRVRFLEHEVTVGHYLRRTLLLHGNTAAAETIDTVSYPAFHNLSNPPSPHIGYPMLCTPPTPLDMLPPERSRDLLPWIHFLSTHGPYPGSLPHCWQVEAYVYTSLAFLNHTERAMANGEILGMSLLLEDVLQTSELATPTQLDPTHFPPSTPSPLPPSQRPTAPTSAHTRTRRPSTPFVSQQPPLRPRSPSQVSISSNASHLSIPVPNRRHSIRRPFSSLSPTPTPPTIYVQVPPLEGSKLIEKFLLLTLQLESLKREWGVKMLGARAITTQSECQWLEDLYRDKVMVVAKKMVAKQQARDLARQQMESETMDDTVSMATFMTEASTETPSAESLELSNDLNETMLRQQQVSRLLELLELYLLQETNRLLSRQHHQILSERERDEATLPLDLWKKSSMKEIMGMPRSHLVEDFVSQLEAGVREKDGTMLIPKDFVSQLEAGVREKDGTMLIPKAHLKDCLQQLSSSLLAREKECYQMYASYYEALLHSQYNQLYQKNQEVEHFRALAKANAQQTKEEALVFMGDHTHSLILEITALRTKISELQQELKSQEKDLRRHVYQEYRSLVDGLFSSSAAIKDKFEDYRGNLYSDVLRSLHEVRQAATASTAKMREKLGIVCVRPGSSVAQATSLKADDLRDIQEENAGLNKMVIKMRAVNQWNRNKTEATHEQQLSSLRLELSVAEMQCLELRMSSEEALTSMQQQVKAMQKSLGRAERECEILKLTLEEEKRKKSSSSKTASKARESLTTRAEKEHVQKISQLKQDLEEKTKQLKAFEADHNYTRRQSDAERLRKGQAVRQIRHQLSQERRLKREAFHQVDELTSQVHGYVEQKAVLHTSIHALQRSYPQATSSTPLMAPTRSANHFRTQRPKSQQDPRSPNNGEVIDLSQEILALKLI